jgi:OTU-like cysteine protease
LFTRFKKRLRREPVGSLAAVLQASSTSAALDQLTIYNRQAAVDKQLADRNLTSINVLGDGNCFFRAISVCLYGHEHEHAALRADIAKHFEATAGGLASAMDIGPEDYAELRKRAAIVGRDGEWAGEDVILTTSAFLQRDIHVYLAGANSSPMIYSPLVHSMSKPINIAFYEPGHYRAVIEKNLSQPHRVGVTSVCNSSPLRLNLPNLVSTSDLSALASTFVPAQPLLHVGSQSQTDTGASSSKSNKNRPAASTLQQGN